MSEWVTEVMIDAPWTYILLDTREWIDKIQKRVETTRGSLFVIECDSSEEAFRRRIMKRGLDRDRVQGTGEEPEGISYTQGAIRGGISPLRMRGGEGELTSLLNSSALAFRCAF